MRIRVNGEALRLDASGALWWPARETLVLADLHFEKGSSYARRGIFLPPYDTPRHAEAHREAAGAIPARRASSRWAIPSTTAAPTPASMPTSASGWPRSPRRRTGSGSPAITIPNRRPGWAARGERDRRRRARLPPRAVACVRRRARSPAICIPATRSRAAAGRLRRRCFVSDGMRMVMPAFGAYAGGLDLYDDVFDAPVSARLPRLHAGHARGSMPWRPSGGGRSATTDSPASAPSAPSRCRRTKASCGRR